MRVALVVVTTLGLVALPFVPYVEQRGPRASLFGWAAFALVLSVVRFFAERGRSLGVDARQRDFDGDAASGLHTAQQ